LEALQVEKNGVDKEFLPGKYEVVESWDELCGFAANGDRKTQKKKIVCSFK
jgi:hypothetical protein